MCRPDNWLRERPVRASQMGKIRALLLFALLLSLPAAADPYVGQFGGEFDGRKYSASIDQFSAGAYDGILLVDAEPMQIDARRHGEYLSGLLRNNSEQYRFRARLQGSILIIEIDDGRRLVLRSGVQP